MMTNVYYQDFSQPHVAVPSINARISIQTFGKIFDKLIPKGMCNILQLSLRMSCLVNGCNMNAGYFMQVAGTAHQFTASPREFSLTPSFIRFILIT